MSAYREAVRLYRETTARSIGAAKDDVLLAARLAEKLERQCIETSESFLKHVKTSHPAPSSGNSST